MGLSVANGNSHGSSLKCSSGLGNEPAAADALISPRELLKLSRPSREMSTVPPMAAGVITNMSYHHPPPTWHVQQPPSACTSHRLNIYNVYLMKESRSLVKYMFWVITGWTKKHTFNKILHSSQSLTCKWVNLVMFMLCRYWMWSETASPLGEPWKCRLIHFVGTQMHWKTQLSKLVLTQLVIVYKVSLLKLYFKY